VPLRDERFGKSFDDVGETAAFRERQTFRGYEKDSHPEFGAVPCRTVRYRSGGKASSERNWYAA